MTAVLLLVWPWLAAGSAAAFGVTCLAVGCLLRLQRRERRRGRRRGQQWRRCKEQARWN